MPMAVAQDVEETALEDARKRVYMIARGRVLPDVLMAAQDSVPVLVCIHARRLAAIPVAGLVRVLAVVTAVTAAWGRPACFNNDSN